MMSNTPLSRILNEIQRSPSDAELAKNLDPDARNLWQELESLANCMKTLDTWEPNDDPEFDVQAVLERLQDTKSLANVPTEVFARSDADREAEAVLPGSAHADYVTRVLGEYDLFEQIGRGGGGTVYRARHRKLRRIVAIKLLNRIDDPRMIARFDREMHAIGKLQHPNIVAATDAGEADGVYYLVMEFVAGKSISQLIRDHGPISQTDACEIVRQAATGLQYIHERGLVHRDIKPANLMLNEAGQVMILDLGLALLHEDDFSVDAMTSSDMLMGTIDYMAPEQAADTHQVDIRADIYSLGATCYTLLTGVPPFGPSRHASPLARIAAITTGTPTPIQSVRPELDAGVIAILKRMLARYPEERYATPQEVADAILPFCGERETNNLSVRFLGASCSVGTVPTRVASDRSGNIGKVDTKPPQRFQPRFVLFVCIALIGVSLVSFSISHHRRQTPLTTSSNVIVPNDEQSRDRPRPDDPPTEREVALQLVANHANISFLSAGGYVGDVTSADAVPPGKLQLEFILFPNSSEVPAEALQGCANLKNLRGFQLMNHRCLTKEHLRAIGQHANLKDLLIGSDEPSDVTDADIAAVLRSSMSLKVVHLKGIAVDGSCWMSIASPSSLLSLAIEIDHLTEKERWATISIAAAEHLSRFENLQTLLLIRARLTDEQFVPISRLHSLNQLSICGSCQINSQIIERLATLPSLTVLSLISVGLKDEHIEALSQMTNLRRLNVAWNDGITAQGIEQLVAALPHCEIEHNVGGQLKTVKPVNVDNAERSKPSDAL
jgi:serine/threonine protein kinase